MLESSQDLFYIVLSVAVLWFTVFLCFFLYQVARVIKNANKVMETVTEKLELINDAVSMVRHSMDGLTSKMGLVSTMIAGLVEKIIVGKISKTLAGDESDTKKKAKTKVKKRVKIAKKK